MDNGEAHFHLTGPEIFRQTNGDFDTFIATVGTGGTILVAPGILGQRCQN